MLSFIIPFQTHAREWGFHTARVSCVAWSPSGRLLASGGLDCTVILWSMDAPTKHHALTSAHVQSQVGGSADWGSNTGIG